MTILITDDNTPKATVTGLGENRKYSFRVKAVNAAGASEPSDPTEEITCKLRKQRPVILKDSIKDVRVRDSFFICTVVKSTMLRPWFVNLNSG